MTDPTPEHVLAAARQQQFLDVISRDAAEARFHEHLDLVPHHVERVSLDVAAGRVLSEDIIANTDVPAFDRSNVDGFAVRAVDTFGAMEENPRRLELNNELLSPGMAPQQEVTAGTATTIATGAVVPRGADAIVMVEHTQLDTDETLLVQHPVVAGQRITYAGTDIARGETVLRQRQFLTSREIGVLAAIGMESVTVYRQPRVAIISTGDEVVPPGQPLGYGQVYDSNAAILSSAVVELGGKATCLGCVADDEREIERVLTQALEYDLVLLSGGTSKGAGDLSYRAVAKLPPPGIVAHGVALKPGKPICLAVTGTTPVVILPGFPTSAVFTFHEFVAPLIRQLAGLPRQVPHTLTATLPVRVNSERGRTEYLLVSLTTVDSGLAAYPMGKGSGSVTTFSAADGFLTIPEQTEILDKGSEVNVQLLGEQLRPADLVVIGSHCVGLDYLLGLLQQGGFAIKSLFVGSSGGLAAVGRGECDVAGIHLVDPATGEYNRPLLKPGMELLPGYQRMQGIVFRPDDDRLAQSTAEEALTQALGSDDCRMVNRNTGSGTRVLIDQLLQRQRPPGFAMQVRSHNAVAAAIAQQRADWGIAIEPVARMYDLGFLRLQPEQFDLVIPTSRISRPAIEALRDLLDDGDVQKHLSSLGFQRGES